MSSIQSVLSSPRATRLLFWLGALVLAAGVVVFVRAIADGPEPIQEKLSNQPAQLPARPETKAPVDPAAKRVARQFIRTAVARRNLAASWKITHPSLRQGLTLKEWKTGNIPVIPLSYPVAKLESVVFKVDESTQRTTVLEVAMIPRPGAKAFGRKIDPDLFWLGLKKVGRGKNARWLVDYWMPREGPIFRAIPGEAGGPS
jgi:hypothetical protein